MDETIAERPQYPARAKTVFRSLRMGKHLCRTDGEDFFDLQRHEAQYKALFTALGYQLVYHGQGFFYFTSESPLQSNRLRGITLFLLILFQDLEDNKLSQPERSWERTLLDRRFMLNELPHFNTGQRRTLMDAVDVTRDNVETKLFRLMIQMGLCESIQNGGFRFKPPVHRFVDLFLRYADDEYWSGLKAVADSERSGEDSDAAAGPTATADELDTAEEKNDG